MVAKQGCVMHYKLVTCETRMYNYSFIFVRFSSTRPSALTLLPLITIYRL